MYSEEDRKKYIEELKERDKNPVEKERQRTYFEGIRKEKLRKGIDYTYEHNPDLARIGTKEQYEEYLENIFPESKLKQIMYHGSRFPDKFEKFNLKFGGMAGRNFGSGVYSTPDFSRAKRYQSTDMKTLIVDVRNPFITCNHYNNFHGANSPAPQNKKITEFVDNDSLINYEYLNRDLLKKKTDFLIEYFGDKNENGFPTYQYEINTNPEIREVVLPNPSQVRILGSKKDKKDFYKFVHKDEIDSLEKKVLTGVFTIFSLAGLIFSANSLTGNVIGISNSNLNFTWPAIFLIGIAGFFLTRKYKK